MIKNTIKTTLLLGALSGLFMGIGYLIGSSAGLMFGFLFAMIINFGSYWFSDKIVLRMHNAKEVSESSKLYRVVKELSQRAKLPIPKVYLINAPSPNAFATGRSPKHAAVAATQSLVDMLSEEELKGVMAHELSHVKHRDTLISTIAVGIASAISMVANWLQWSLIFGFGQGDDDNGFGGILGTLFVMIVTPVIATLIQLGISRSREYAADEGATRLMKTPQPLINALQKLEACANGSFRNEPKNTHASSLYIVNPFKGISVSKWFSTHPSTEDRIERMKQVRVC